MPAVTRRWVEPLPLVVARITDCEQNFGVDMKTKSSALILAIALSFCSVTADAKPMSDASLEPMPAASLGGAAQSPYVVLASYLGSESVKGRSNEDIYLSGWTTSYRIESVLKKSSELDAKADGHSIGSGKEINVCHVVHDLTPCLADETFRFSSKLLPPKRSRWILFLVGKNKDVWQTYRGHVGRLNASESNIKKAQELIGLNSSSGERVIKEPKKIH